MNEKPEKKRSSISKATIVVVVPAIALMVVWGYSIGWWPSLTSHETTFSVMINGQNYGNLTVTYDVSKGVNEEQASDIVQKTFDLAKSTNPAWFGEGYTRIDSLNLDDPRYVIARLIWGRTLQDLDNPTPYNVFDVTVDLPEQTISAVYPMVSP